MSNYDLYNKLMEISKENNESAFNAAARNWIEEANEAPFEDADAAELFFKAKRNYNIWNSGSISSRVSKRRMLEAIRKLAALDLPNPYKPEESKKETDDIKVEIKEEPKKEVQSEKKEEPIKVLGVVPDAVVKETEDGKGEVEIKMPETKEEPEKHGIFRKKR